LAGGAFFAYLCICTPVPAESFRVHQTAVAVLDLENQSASAELGINDALAVKLPKDLTFIQGIEIDIKIPQIVASWRDSMVWTLFDRTVPDPGESQIDYSGTHLLAGTLPPRLSWTADIPLVKNNNLKESPYVSKLDILPDSSSGYIFMRLQQAMKGTPDEFGDARFDVSVKLLLVDQGKLLLKFTGPDRPLKPYSVFVDEQPVTPQAAGNMIDPGVHSVSVVSDFYRNEVRTVRVEQAKVCLLPVTLRGIEPTVQITAPENTAIYFDETELRAKDKPFVIAEGDHKVRFVIGDYEIIKTFTAKKGRSYTVALSVDATVSEED
jgi:hypothetical protein